MVFTADSSRAHRNHTNNILSLLPRGERGRIIFAAKNLAIYNRKNMN